MANSVSFPPHPLYPIILGGSVNILAGASGTGKTALIAGWAKAFHDGTPINGHTPGMVSDVTLVSADRSYVQSTKRWFDLVGFDDIRVYSIQDDLNFNLDRLDQKKDRVGILGTCLNELGVTPHTLVFVDPIALFLGGNLNDYDTCLVACSKIRRICRLRQISLIGLAHSAKQIADQKRRYLRLQDRIAGSTAIFGYSDTQMYFASPEEMSTEKNPVAHHTLHWNPHHAPAETFKVERDPETGLFLPGEPITPETPVEAAERAKEDAIRAKLERATKLLDWIADPPQLTAYGDLATVAQEHQDLKIRSSSTLRKYLVLLIEHGYIEQVGHGYYQKRKPA